MNTSLLSEKRLGQIAVMHLIRKVKRREKPLTDREIVDRAMKFARKRSIGFGAVDLIRFGRGIVSGRITGANAAEQERQIAVTLTVDMFLDESGHVYLPSLAQDVGNSFAEMKKLVPEAKNITSDEARCFTCMIIHLALLVALRIRVSQE